VGETKICVLSEWLRGSPDEGIHNLAQNLVDHWSRSHSVRTLAIGSELRVNRLFLSWNLRKFLWDSRPDLIVYISPSSAKVSALLRARMLKLYVPSARVYVVATQPVRYRFFERWLLPLVAPGGIFVQSSRSRKELRRLAGRVHFLPSGVDTSRFTPVDDARKGDLRRKYKTSESAFVLLHVGHINRGRNVEVLGRLARSNGMEVVLVGSTSTPQDEELAVELDRSGVRLIREFVPRIEEVYQLADVYLFPVRSEEAAIGVPLSVLEAMACNIPVITTPFGGLPLMFERGDGFAYFDDESELPGLIHEVRELKSRATRRMVEPFDWEKVASEAMDTMRTRRGAP
jgi:glycosyltransferase involved in cell wall biosynthesis